MDGRPMRIGGLPERLVGRVNFGLIAEQRRPAIRRRLNDEFTIEKSMRCAGHEFASIACGKSHFHLYNRLWAWDHAPGVLLHREAGGYAARQDGAPYRPTERTRGLLCAPDADWWRRIDDILKPD